MKKYFILGLILLSTSSIVNAASGSTIPNIGGGGGTVAYNYTLAKFELLPQCFPWVFASEYFAMNIASMYENQEICRQNRSLDFRF